MICIIVLCSVILGLSNSFSKTLGKNTNNDGKPDIWGYYDEKGKIIKVEWDSNSNGKDETQFQGR